MRTLRLCSAWLVLTAWIAAGCADQNAQQRQEAARQIDQALAILVQVSVGVPAQPDRSTLDLASFRQRQFQQAASLLQSAAARGSPAQELTARRLLASVYQATASDSLEHARQAWSALSPSTTALWRAINTLERAAARLALVNLEQAPSLELLQQTSSQLAVQRDQLTQQHQEQELAIQELHIQQKKLLQQRNQAAAQAQALRDQAFTLQGQEQYELYLKALQIERQAQIADAQAEQTATQIELANSELQLIRTRLEQSHWALESLDQQRQMMAQHHDQAHSQFQSLRNDPQNPAGVVPATAAVIKAFSALDESFTRDVQPLFAKTGAEADQAVRLLSIKTGSDAHDRPSLALELAGAQAAKLAILSDQIAALALLGRSYQAAQYALEQAQASQPAARITQRLDQIRQDQHELIAAAQQLLSQAQKTLTQLPAPSGVPAENMPATILADQLELFSHRIAQAKL